MHCTDVSFSIIIQQCQCGEWVFVYEWCSVLVVAMCDAYICMRQHSHSPATNLSHSIKVECVCVCVRARSSDCERKIVRKSILFRWNHGNFIWIVTKVVNIACLQCKYIALVLCCALLYCAYVRRTCYTAIHSNGLSKIFMPLSIVIFSLHSSCFCFFFLFSFQKVTLYLVLCEQ